MGSRVLPRVIGILILLVAAIVVFVAIGLPAKTFLALASNGWLWLRIAAALAAILAIVLLIRIGYRHQWTGFAEEEPKPENRETRGRKTVWDWLQLLVVPLVLIVIGLGFSMLQEVRQQRIENRRANAERVLVNQRAQDEALQAYLDQMSQLILDRNLLKAEQDKPVYKLARARTSTIVLNLGSENNDSVIRFLRDSGLDGSSEESVGLLRVIALKNAHLRGVLLPQADLRKADLRKAILHRAVLYGVNLSKARLSKADLSKAILTDADLSDADLSGADLSGADPSGADPSGADLIWASLSGADPNGADPNGADPNGADLSGADLSGADLSGVDLSGATGWTKDQLTTARTLEGATMPDGQVLKSDDKPNGPTFEEWLKNKGRSEDHR